MFTQTGCVCCMIETEQNSNTLFLSDRSAARPARSGVKSGRQPVSVESGDSLPIRFSNISLFHIFPFFMCRGVDDAAVFSCHFLTFTIAQQFCRRFVKNSSQFGHQKPANLVYSITREKQKASNPISRPAVRPEPVSA